jgi:transketolase
VGVAKALKIQKKNARVYCIIGDGESQEGQVWEASMAAAQFGLDNLLVMLDRNNLQIDGCVDDVNSLKNPADRWKAFGFAVFEADGHDVAAISQAVEKAHGEKGRPGLIVLNTTKGKGVSYVEKAGAGNHNMTISPEQMAQALKELT